MRMRIDAARHDEASRAVEHRIGLQIGADRGDFLALDEDVGLIGAVGGDDRSAFNDERHIGSPLERPISDEGSHATISAFSRTACISTLAPAVAHSCLMSSLSLWLTPSTHGVKIIDVGATRAR